MPAVQVRAERRWEGEEARSLAFLRLVRTQLSRSVTRNSTNSWSSSTTMCATRSASSPNKARGFFLAFDLFLDLFLTLALALAHDPGAQVQQSVLGLQQCRERAGGVRDGDIEGARWLQRVPCERGTVRRRREGDQAGVQRRVQGTTRDVRGEDQRQARKEEGREKGR